MSLPSLRSLSLKTDQRQRFRARNIFVVILFVIMFFGSLQFISVDSSNNIDGSWHFTLPGLLHSSQQLGVNVFFNYGPMFERGFTDVNPSATFGDFVVSDLYVFVILGLLIFALISFMKHWRKELAAYPLGTVAAALLITMYQIDALFCIICIVGLLAVWREKRPWAIALILIGLELFSLYKFSFSLLLVLAGLLALFKGFERPQLKRTARYWAGFAVSFWLVYSLVTLNLDPYHFWQYFYYGTINSIYYNEFMSLPLTLNYQIVLLMAALIALAALPLLGYLYEKRRLLKPSELPRHIRDFVPLIIILLASFVVFKEALVRTDGHVAIFMPMLVVWAGLVIYFLRTTKLKTLRRYTWAGPAYFCLVVVIYLVVISLLTDTPPQTQVHLTLKSYANSIVDNRINYGYFKSTRAASRQSFEARAHELDTLLAQPNIPPKGSEIIDWGNTTLLANILTQHGYHVLQEPFLQNYAAHPPTLFDPVYIKFLRAHPHAYVFEEETEGSVTEYLPTFQLNNYFEYVIHNYAVMARADDAKQYFFRPVSQNTETCSSYGSTRSQVGQLITLPQPKLRSDQYLKAKVAFSGTLPESIFGLLVKQPEYHIHIFNQDNGEMEWRVTKTTLKHGVNVDPLYLNVHDYVNNVPFQLKHMGIYGALNRHGKLTIQYQTCTFKK